MQSFKHTTSILTIKVIISLSLSWGSGSMLSSLGSIPTPGHGVSRISSTQSIISGTPMAPKTTDDSSQVAKFLWPKETILRCLENSAQRTSLVPRNRNISHQKWGK